MEQRHSSIRLLREPWNKLKNDNAGASLVMVMLVTAIVSTLITIVLLIVLINFYMKATDVKANKNFYDAETAMDEIRIGLSEKFEVAFGDAYIDTMMNCTATESDKQMQYLFNAFADKMRESTNKDAAGNEVKLETGTSVLPLYNTEYLALFLKETKDHAVVNKLYDSATNEPLYCLNIDTIKGTLTLKNVSVQYTDDEGYVTSITSDIKMSVPSVTFPGDVTLTNILSYALIACDHIEVSGAGATTTVRGNVLFGTGGYTADDTTHYNTIADGAILRLESQSAARGYMVSGAPFLIKDSSTVSIDNMEVWADQIKLDNSSVLYGSSGRFFLRDDLELGKGSRVTLSDELFAYGNRYSAVNAESADDKAFLSGDTTIREDVEEHPANYSSAILVNGANSKLDLGSLSRFRVAGTAYINNHETGGVQMGNSVALKSDQRAYLIPLSAIGADYDSGGTNPMSQTQYTKLREEIAASSEEYTLATDVPVSAIIDYDTPLPEFEGKTLHELGVSGCNVTFSQTPLMCYLFCVFDDEEHANAFYQMYNEAAANAERLTRNIQRYFDMSDVTGLAIPTPIDDPSYFFFNGNVISTNGPSALVLPDTLSVDEAALEKERANEISYQDTFYTLKKKLTTSYEKLTDEEKEKGIFYNLLRETPADPTMINGATYFQKPSINGLASIASSNPDCYYDSSTYSAAIIADNKNGDAFVINDNWKSILGGSVVSNPQSSLNMVVATGDVRVSTNFEGLIFAQGKIIIDSGVTLTASPEQALLAANATPMKGDKSMKMGYRVKDFFNDPAIVSMGGAVSGSSSSSDSGEETEAMAIDYITYENWTRR